MHDNGHIDPVPVNRSTIFHAVCGQVHAPEQCRGPLDRGVLNGCLYCGGKDHLTDICPYMSLLPPNQDEWLRYYLHVYSRQGLAPAASNISFERFAVGQGHKATLPVLSRVSAHQFENKQKASDNRAGLEPYWKTFDYSRLDPDDELSRLPGTDNTLRHWANHGPLPNRRPSAREDVVEKDHDLEDYGPKEDVPMYNQWWTLFVNDFVPPPFRPKVVELPSWVTSFDGQPLGLITPYNKNPLPQERRRGTLAPGSRNFNIRGAANQIPSALDRFDAVHNFRQAAENSHGPVVGRVDTIYNFGAQAGQQSHGPVGRVLKAESPDRVVKKEESPLR